MSQAENLGQEVAGASEDFPVEEEWYGSCLWLVFGTIDTSRDTVSPEQTGKVVVIFPVLWSGAHGVTEKGKKVSCWEPNTKAKIETFWKETEGSAVPFPKL